MAYGSEITAKLGLNTEAFSSSLAKANSSVAVFANDAGRVIAKKFEFKDLFRGLAQGLGIFGVQQIAEKLIEPFKASAESAQRIAEYSEQAAAATERMLSARRTDLQNLEVMEKRLAKMQRDGAEMTSPGFFRGFIGAGAAALGFTSIAAKMLVDEDALAEANQKHARDLAVLNEQIAAKRQAIEQKTSAGAEASSREIAALDKERLTAVEKRADYEREAARAKLSDEQLVADLTKEKIKNQQELNALLQFEREGGELTAHGNERIVTLKQQQAELEKRILELTGNRAIAEAAVTREIASQEAAKKVIAEMEQQALRDKLGSAGRDSTEFLIDGIHVSGRPRDRSLFESASPEALQEFIRRQQLTIGQISSGFGRGAGALTDVVTGGLIRNLALSTLQTEVGFARDRLNDFSRFSGRSRADALRDFQGDPLAFDRLYESSQRNIDATTKAALGIEKLNRLFEAGGITLRTVDVTPRNPRG